jgi:hypothetical protein
MNTREPHHVTQLTRATSSSDRRGATDALRTDDDTCQTRRKVCHTDKAVLDWFRKKFRFKPAYELHLLTGYHERTCDHWLETNRLPAEALAALIRSNYGFHILVAIMGDARPAWFVNIFRHVRALAIRRLQALTERMIKGAADADRDAVAEIARADALLAEICADVDRSFAPALVPALGASDRALAPARGS